MHAFIKTAAGLFKIYRQGDDWQVIGPDGFERWFTIWTNDQPASLLRAVRAIPDANPSDLVVCN